MLHIHIVLLKFDCIIFEFMFTTLIYIQELLTVKNCKIAVEHLTRVQVLLSKTDHKELFKLMIVQTLTDCRRKLQNLNFSLTMKTFMSRLVSVCLKGR